MSDSYRACADDLIEKFTTSIEQCGWRDAEVIRITEVMAVAAER
ncbi:hypothetical protein O206_19945 [Ochrobactrum sp. EGD-AQ16]|nr:hypothetical protein O206_19945 [Ochrobactrum sp. EGD-AQ16]